MLSSAAGDPNSLRALSRQDELAFTSPAWANEQRLMALMENLRSGVVIHGHDSRVLTANSAACRLLGLTLDQMRGKTAMDPYWRFLEEDGSPMPLARFPVNQVLANSLSVNDLVIGVQRAELAEPVWVIANAYLEQDNTAESRHVVVTFSDVTELKRAQQSAEQAQQDLKTTLQAVPDLMFEMALDGTICGFHSPRERLIFLSPEEFLQRKVDDLLPPAAAQAFHAALQQANEVGLASGQQYSLEGPAGTFWFELSVARKQATEQANATFIVLARNISDRKRAEMARQEMEWELAEAQRIESIGTLAGGIAHDFNNILAAILGNVAIAREELASSQSVLTSLEQIQRASQRARNLVQQILSFSRRDRHGHQPHELGPIVQETMELLRATLPAGVSLQARLCRQPLWVLCDSTQLQQVLMNLCTNAWQAFEGAKGDIELSLDTCEVDLGWRTRLPLIEVGRHAHIRIRDNGCGMDAETLQRIFDPFFTTKPVGKGTGLGLSVVHGIVRSHRGAVEVESTPRVGSVFHLYLPLQEAPQAPATVVEAPAVPLATRAVVAKDKHILCIDYDRAVLQTVERLLRLAGYTVSTETSPAAGVARVREHPHAFDAVVTDYNMPGFSGLEVAAQIARYRPGLPVLMMSGLMPEGMAPLARAEGVLDLLYKENISEELVDRLARCLG